jgi:tRNA threonylcarbamoyl adenosine modification protein YeaZ
LVLVIDTSSARSALALVRNGEALAEDIVEAGRDQVLASRTAALVDPERLTGVAVALGPGSFTGLRVGVSYGVGLALGLEVPLWGLDSLLLQAARSLEPATALVEAGRDRVYWLEAGATDPGHGEPAEMPRDRPAVGWLRPRTAAAVRESGIHLLDDGEAVPFAQAAATLLREARPVGYGTVKLRYMHSFGPLRGQRW